VAFMIQSISAIVACLFQLMFGVRGVLIASNRLSRYCEHECDYDDDDDVASVNATTAIPTTRTTTTVSPDLCKMVRTGLAIESLLLILAIVGGIVSIWSSAICCKVACCCYTTMPTHAGPMTFYTQQEGGQVVVLTAYPGAPQGPAGMSSGDGVSPALTVMSLPENSPA
jgi:hypothetical protein